MSTVYRCIVCNTTYDNNTDAQNCYYEHVENKEPIPFVRHKNSNTDSFIMETAKKVLEENQGLFKKLAAAEKNQSVKFDNGKAPISLIPKSAIFAAANVLAFGAKKYDPHNWRKSGFEWTRLLDSCMRHLQEWNDGIDLDSESKLNHVHHALVNLMFLCEHIEKNLGKDNRYKNEK